MAMTIQYFFLHFTHKPYSLTTLTSNYNTTHSPSLTPMWPQLIYAMWPTYNSIFTDNSILATVTHTTDGTTNSYLMVVNRDDTLPAFEISNYVLRYSVPVLLLSDW